VGFFVMLEQFVHRVEMNVAADVIAHVIGLHFGEIG
jgi:hypothetical protein